MKIKKRYILLLVFIGLIVFGTVISVTRPVLPVIQLPGECYPGTATGFDYFPCVTNTIVTTAITFLIVAIFVLGLRVRSRTADEVPTGMYNLFEMIVEVAFNYAKNLAGTKRAKNFIPLFITIVLYVLVANWIELVPFVDSFGFYEHIPHLEAQKEVDRVKTETGDALTEEEYHLIEEAKYEEVSEANVGAFKSGPFLLKSPDNAVEGDIDPNDPRAGLDPDNADWAIVAFLRAPATDLNFTLSLALVTMVLVQYYGFRYLGAGYLKKFFPTDSGVEAMKKNPIRAIDWAVGILELVGEISRVISFTFRLFGNIFAGQVLLFVISFILPVIAVAFFGLEFFVGLIQALIFGLLGLMFLSGASEHHGEGEHHD